MLIRDVMTGGVVLASPSMPLVDAAAAMRDHDFGILPVGENDRLVGTVTDRDITVRIVAEGRDLSKATVRDAMSEGLVYCFDDQDVDEAAALMSRHQVRRLPVLNRKKRLVGIVALGDLAASGATEAQEEAKAALAGVSAN